MPFRLNEFRAKVQFVTSARMPSLITKARTQRDLPSNTTYIQLALCEALSRDLGIPLEELLAELPPSFQRDERGRYAPSLPNRR